MVEGYSTKWKFRQAGEFRKFKKTLWDIKEFNKMIYLRLASGGNSSDGLLILKTLVGAEIDTSESLCKFVILLKSFKKIKMKNILH